MSKFISLRYPYYKKSQYQLEEGNETKKIIKI